MPEGSQFSLPFIKYQRFLSNGLRLIFPFLKARVDHLGTYCIFSLAGLRATWLTPQITAGSSFRSSLPRQVLAPANTRGSCEEQRATGCEGGETDCFLRKDSSDSKFWGTFTYFWRKDKLNSGAPGSTLS